MDQTVSCSLRPGDFDQRTEAWRGLLAERILTREPTQEGCVLTLSDGPGVAAAVRRLADAERECCPWMSVRVIEGDVVTVELSSSTTGGPEAIRELFQPA